MDMLKVLHATRVPTILVAYEDEDKISSFISHIKAGLKGYD